MKKHFLFFSILFLIAEISFAQNEFAPVGAEWYHKMNFGVFHSKVTRDTVIDGISCRLIEATPFVKNPAQSPTVHGYFKFFVYNNADTVFVYNTIFNRFTPLYIFNVTVGDTLTLPALQPKPKVFFPVDYDFVDSNFCIIIDSVKIVNYDNQALKTVYTHSLNRDDYYNTYPIYSFGGTNGSYAERIGTLGAGFLPYCENCIDFLDDSAVGIGSFRCYSDNQSPPFAVKLVDTCDNGAIVGINKTGFKRNLVTVYPNPGSGKICVAFSNSFETNGNWILTDLIGKVLFRGTIQKNSLGFNMDLSACPTGIYFLKLHDENGQSKVMKIVLNK